MKIRHYLYNAFLAEEEGLKIAIDPGQNLWLFKLDSLIPKSEWKGVTHVFITHGDPDHFVYAVPMAKATCASAICGEALVDDFLSSKVEDVYKVDVGGVVSLGNIRIRRVDSETRSLDGKALWRIDTCEQRDSSRQSRRKESIPGANKNI